MANRALRLSDLEAEPIQELWPQWLEAGTLNWLVGDPGLGKSTVAYDWAKRVVNDELMPDGSLCQMPGNVLIVSMEESMARIKGRFVANGADQDRIFLVNKRVKRDHPPRGVDPEGTFELPTDLGLLREYVEEHGVTFIILDPWIAIVKASLHNWASQPARQLLTMLNDFAEETGVCILAINHWRRNAKKDTVEGMDGSAQLGKGARRAIGYYPDPTMKGRYILRVIKTNDGEVPTDITLRHDGNTVQYLTGLQELEQARQEQLAWEYAATVVRAELAKDPYSEYHPTQLRHLCGVSAWTMRGICRELARRGEIEQTARGLYKANTYIPIAPARRKRP